jgi:spore coat protein JB
MRKNGGTPREAGELLYKISSLGFVKTELELYLDTHPTCRTALDMYHKTVDELKILTETYKNLYGPLTASDSVDTDSWSWVNMPWPWHHGNGARDGKGEGR